MEPGPVVDVWNNDIVGNIPQEMNEFASYFERTWIGNPTAEPIFDNYLWNMYDTVLAGLPRSKDLVFRSWLLVAIRLSGPSRLLSRRRT